MKMLLAAAEAIAFLDANGIDAERPEEIAATLASIARIAHEANRAWFEYNDDTSQPTWDRAPEWQKASAIAGVAFHLRNPAAGDSASHDAWMSHKLAEGWIYGETKDPGASPPTHPCLVPFDQLPAAQQFKDRIFRTIVHAAAPREATALLAADAPADA